MSSPAQESAPETDLQGQDGVEAAARGWVARGGPPAPELSREPRSLAVVWLRAAADATEGRAIQLFFRKGPTPARFLLSARADTAMGEEAFVRRSACDLFVRWDSPFGRWRGAMRPNGGIRGETDGCRCLPLAEGAMGPWVSHHHQTPPNGREHGGRRVGLRWRAMVDRWNHWSAWSAAAAVLAALTALLARVVPMDALSVGHAAWR